MSYPISINKEAPLKSQNLNVEQIMQMFSERLEDSNGSFIEIENNKIKILETDEFSSKTSLRNLNKGEISFFKTEDHIIIKGKLLLIENLIISLVIISIGYFIIFKSGVKLFDGIFITAILMALAIAFLYVFPMIAFNSFFNEVIQRIKEEEGKKGTVPNNT